VLVQSTADQSPILWAMIASILLRCALLLTLDNSEARYTLEFFPILFVFASIVFTRKSRVKTPLAASLR